MVTTMSPARPSMVMPPELVLTSQSTGRPGRARICIWALHWDRSYGSPAVPSSFLRHQTKERRQVPFCLMEVRYTPTAMTSPHHS
jgi:hypothetical protein